MKNCELCKLQATIYCESDQASLCWDCDSKVHGANFLVAKHSRSLLCHVCQSTTLWKASGEKLGQTISICESCINSQQQQQEEEISEGDNDDEDDINDDEDDISDDEDEDDEEEEEEEGENQVVPWSKVTATPPPPSSSSSSSEDVSDSVNFFSSKRRRKTALDLQSQDDDDDDLHSSKAWSAEAASADSHWKGRNVESEQAVSAAFFQPLKTYRSQREVGSSGYYSRRI